MPPGLEENADEMTDEEIVAAYREIGLGEDYSRFVIDVLRGRTDLPC